MIRKIKYNEIDFRKYSECLERSEQRNWYARKEVLDELSGNWHILVYGDYEAVMPVNIKIKFGVKLVHMPLFCQQLGVFSHTDDPEMNGEFLRFLKRNYQVFFYSFNHKNMFSADLEKRKNYIIPVSDYATLRRKGYFKGRKSTVKCAQHLLYKEITAGDDCIGFIEKNFKGLPKKSDFKKFKSYLRFLSLDGSLKLCGAYSGETLINLAVLVSEPEQLSLLALINDEAYKDEDGASFLIDRILNLYIGERSFDFMGSNIRGIEIFFKSFGAELHDYSFVENKLLKRFS